MSVARVVINGHDYTKYIKHKTGFEWSRENTNDSDAGRDAGDVMHTNVTSHQRKINFKMGPMSFAVGQQLEADLAGNDDGVTVMFPDLDFGMDTEMLFYNTSIQAAMESFTEDGIMLDNVTFSLETVHDSEV